LLKAVVVVTAQNKLCIWLLLVGPIGREHLVLLSQLDQMSRLFLTEQILTQRIRQLQPLQLCGWLGLAVDHSQAMSLEAQAQSLKSKPRFLHQAR
jgi:hypothetical protein